MSQQDDDIFDPVEPGVAGGQVIIPNVDPIPGGPAHMHGGMEVDEEDHESFEDDENLLNPGSSPEFEHLRKPKP